MSSEFDIIRDYFTRTARRRDVVLGIGDDAALLHVPAGHDLVLTTDTLVAERHFSTSTSPADIGWKSLAVNLSDLAAMGAEPAWFTLALTLPNIDTGWLQGFAAGLFELADHHGVELVGGDTTRGPLSVTIQAHGLVPGGKALRRSGAVVGDLICVTGTLGDASLALALGENCPPELRSRLDRPTPRVTAGVVLREYAHAAIDLSDGCAGDLAHVLCASAVGARIDVDALPSSAAFNANVKLPERLRHQLAGGDDYELCVCMPENSLDAAKQHLDCQLTVIGQVTAGHELDCIDSKGRKIDQAFSGYDHFRS